MMKRMIHWLHAKVCDKNHYCTACGHEIAPDMIPEGEWVNEGMCSMNHDRAQFGVTWRYVDGVHQHKVSL